MEEYHTHKYNLTIKCKLGYKMEVVICAITMFFAILTKVSAKLPHIPSCICDANGVKHNGVLGSTITITTILMKDQNNIFIDSLAGGGSFKDFEI
jgi:hypothetical protein